MSEISSELNQIADRIHEIASQLEPQPAAAADVIKLEEKIDKVIEVTKKLQDKPTDANLTKFEKETEKLITEVEKTKNEIGATKPKINYDIRKLRKGEVRPSMIEALEANQVRYWGIMKVDSRLAAEYANKHPSIVDSMINYGISKLREGEVRPSMIEALEVDQVRYWGLKKIDSKLVAEYTRAAEYTQYDKDKKSKKSKKEKKEKKVPPPIDKALSSAQQTQFVPEDGRNQGEMDKAVSEIIQPAGEDCLTRGTKTLQPHQRSFVNAFMENKKSRGVLAIHGIGSGKTLTAVVTSQCYLDMYPDSKVVVITPASLQANFKQELYEYSPAIKNDKRYEFYTYDSYTNKGGDCTDALLIIDEAHNLRNVEGVKVTEILEGCAVKARKVLLLTATPVVNENYDIISLMKLIDPRIKITKSEMKSYTEDDIKKIFNCKVSLFMPNEADKIKYFPRVFRVAEPLEMSDSYYKKYKQVETNTMDEQTRSLLGKKKGGRADVNPTAFYNGVRRGANALESENSPKIKYIINLIKNGDEDEDDKFNRKFVIFSHFLDAGSKLLIKALKKEGIPYGEINGSMSKAKREDVVKKYVDGTIDVIIISKAGAEGLNLKNTGHLVIMEPAWNETLIDQVIGRAVRFKGHEGSAPTKRNVKIHQLLLLKPTEYENIIENGFPEMPRKGASIDLYLYLFSLDKQRRLKDFLDDIQKFAKQIDDPSCKVAPKKEIDYEEEKKKEIERLKELAKYGYKREQAAAKKKLLQIQQAETQKEMREAKRQGKKYVNPLFAVFDDIDKQLDEADAKGPVDKVTDKYGSYWPTLVNLERDINKARWNIDKDPSKATQKKLMARSIELLDKAKTIYKKHFK